MERGTLGGRRQGDGLGTFTPANSIIFLRHFLGVGLLPFFLPSEYALMDESTKALAYVVLNKNQAQVLFTRDNTINK